MHKVRVCLEIMNGLAKDEQGGSAPCGAHIEIGESEKEFPYEKLTANLNIPTLLARMGLSQIVKPEDVRIITPEEYDSKYT